jgi:ankyrin repeat protein
MHADGYTALMLSAKLGHNDIMKILIDQRANVNAAGKIGFMAQTEKVNI